MSKDRRSRRKKDQIKAALASGEAVRLIGRHRGATTYHKGFVAGVGPEWILMHTLNLDPFVLNGYTAVSSSEIRDIERFEHSQPFVSQALTLRGMERNAPADVDVESLAGLIRTAGNSYPIVSIYVEDGRCSFWYIGKVLKVGKRRVEIRTIDNDGAWSHTYRVSLRFVTAVEFDDGYARALWQVNQAFHNTLLAGTPNVGST